jgi:cbb3-type cytochrome c oxidase subunit III
VRANKILLLAASWLTLAVLAVAAWQEGVGQEWRRIQRDYRARLAPEQAADFRVQLRQLYVPALGVTDRCITCHLGMAPGETAIEGDRVFGRHPDVPHEPAEYGCATCHGGQGRATSSRDAHGDVEFWPHPMLTVGLAQAGCGGCHTHLAVPNQVEIARGRALVDRHDCLSCHALDGRGGTLRPGTSQVAAPDLSRAGASGHDPRWYEAHLEKHERAEPGPWRASFGPIPAEDRAAIAAVLDSRVGAPKLVDAKALFHSLGCRGCHKVAGVGGDDGPDLTTVGEKDPGQTDFSQVPGEHTIGRWFAEHFRAPAAVVPGSMMPQMGLGEADIEKLTLYMLSLRRSDRPEAFWPMDRVRAERLREREFATDGATLFGTFCSACHGPRGEGMRYPGMAAFPAIGNPDFLAVASDRFIAETIRHGRPGRRMPAWGDGGLRPEEIARLVTHVRSLGGTEAVPAPLDEEPRRWVKGDAVLGSRLYADACASCHGAHGEGAEGSALANPRLLAAATDTYLVETVRRGRRGTSMPGFASSSPTHRVLADDEIAATVAFIRSWEVP